jgi:hypothetical protein
MGDDRTEMTDEHDPTACHLCPACAARLEAVAQMAVEVRAAVQMLSERGIAGLLTSLRR